MNALIPRLMAVVLALVAVRAPAVAEDDLESELKPLFELYADGMNGKRYGDFLAACDMSSRSLFRELTLYEMSLMPAEELRTVLPWDDENRPVPLAELVRMTNEEFWTVYLKWMKRHQEATATLYAERHEDGAGPGRPTYVHIATVRKEDVAYMIVDRRYKQESPVPVPLLVVEAVREGGRWKLKLPREILWDAMEQARARKISVEEEAGKAGEKDGHDRAEADHDHKHDHGEEN